MGYVFVSPSVLLFLCFVLLPAVMALFLSLTTYDILSPIKFVGLSNYERLMRVFMALRNVALDTIMYVPLMITLALALNRKVPRVSSFRTI
jgi:multiple sugar transport system permease protein